MENQENEIARGLIRSTMAHNSPLDDSVQRQQLVQQMARQQSALTNLLAQIKDVTEQAETTPAEPLLSKQLYDILRRADQMHTDTTCSTWNRNCGSRISSAGEPVRRVWRGQTSLKS